MWLRLENLLRSAENCGFHIAACLPQVVLVANSLPAINDITAGELRSVSSKLALRGHYCAVFWRAIYTGASAGCCQGSGGMSHHPCSSRCSSNC